jgi:hypothetical protein
MKNLVAFLILIILMFSCGESQQGGVVNDGIQPIDSNGGLADTAFYKNESATDTSKGEHRVGTSKRDTFDNNPNR